MALEMAGLALGVAESPGVGSSHLEAHMMCHWARRNLVRQHEMMSVFLLVFFFSCLTVPFLRLSVIITTMPTVITHAALGMCQTHSSQAVTESCI